MKQKRFQTIRTTLIGSQPKCADLLGVSKRAVQRYESGESEIPGPVALIMDLINLDSSIIETINTLSRLD